jgi:hypothetical protein
MRNALIFGSSRSGSSLLAHMAYAAGYFIGEDLLRPSLVNPNGFFESQVINKINDAVIRPLMWHPPHWEVHEPWISVIGMDAKVPSLEGRDQVKWLMARTPFCYKDPRFSITYPAWKDYLTRDCVKLITFRHPSAYVNSLLRGIKLGEWKWMRKEPELMLASWVSIYRHIFKNDDGQFLYFHFNELLTAEGKRRVENCLEAVIPEGLAEAELCHFPSETERVLSVEIVEVYHELCARSGARYGQSGKN